MTYLRVYRAVRAAGHSSWRAIRCCNDVRRGSWSARDVGEMRAQAMLLSQVQNSQPKEPA